MESTNVDHLLQNHFSRHVWTISSRVGVTLTGVSHCKGVVPQIGVGTVTPADGEDCDLDAHITIYVLKERLRCVCTMEVSITPDSQRQLSMG